MSSVFVQKWRFSPLPRNRLVGVSLAALVITFLTWWGLWTPIRFPYTLEVSVQTFAPASTQIYFDRGAGLREVDSSSQRIGVGTTEVRLPLPTGTYKALRFDPIDRAGTASFGTLRIVGPRGRIIRTVTPAELSPNNQIKEVHVAGGILSMTSTADANDPQFAVNLDPTVELPFDFFDQLIAARWWLLRCFVACLAVVLLAENTWRNRAIRKRSLFAFTRERPRLALAICAGFAAVASSYPVVFFEKSFVSPNTTMLLYNGLPSVPGYSDARPEDARGADIGAMMWQHLPYTVQEHRALRAGALPLWNRYASCGVTLFGQGQSMLGDPLQLLVVAANGASWAFDVKFVLVKALFGCGLAWCVWAMTRDFAASAILCFSSVFIAFFNYRLNHPSIFTMGYAPWILVAWFQLTAAIDRRSFRNALILWYAANWMVITSGTVKEAYLLGLSLNITGALIFFTTTTPPAQKIRRTVVLGLASIAFILVSAPLWWSFLEALSSAYTGYDVPGIVQIDGQWLVGLFDDIFYRAFMRWHNIYKPAANFLILLGCLWAVLQTRRLLAAPAALIILLASLVAICLAFHFGPPSWSPSWVLKVPLLRNVHNFSTIFSCVAIVHLCVLAGWGFSAARQPLASGQARRYGWLMAAVLLALFIPYFAIAPSESWEVPAWHGWSWHSPDLIFVRAQVILLPLAAWILVGIASRHLRGIRIGFGSVIAAVLALVVLLARHGQHLRVIPTTYLAAPGIRADLQSPSPSVDFFLKHTADEPGRVVGLARNVFSGFATSYGLEVINGANALENRPYRQLAEAAGLVTPGNWIFELPADQLPQWRPIADFLNVRYLATSSRASLSVEGYREIATLDLKIFESEHAWPRAFFTNHLERYATPADLVRLIQARVARGPFAAMQDGDKIPAFPESQSTVGSAAPTVVAARNYNLDTNTTAFTIDAPSAGIAVLHETWLPNDFSATLNGKPVDYVRVNHAFKGVVIPRAGSYRIEFSYWPRGLSQSLVAAAIGLLVVIASLFATRWLQPVASGAPQPSVVH